MNPLHTVATGQISVIFRVLKIWVWKTYLTKVIEYNLILYTILEVARFLRIVYKSSHKKLFSISNHNFKHRCRITWNWQLFNHFCLPHFGLRQITNTLEMTHRVSQCCWIDLDKCIFAKTFQVSLLASHSLELASSKHI